MATYNFTPTNVANTGSYNTEDWLSTFGGLFTGGLTGAASAAGVNEQVARLRALGGAASTDYGNLAQQAVQGVEFTPYTITTPGLGTVQQTAPGVISQTLTPQQQANIDAAAALQGNLYGQQMPDTTGIQQQAFGNVGNYLTPQQNQQLTGLSTLFGGIAGQQAAGFGAPTGLEGTTQQALQGASQGLGQIGTGLGGINQFGQQALQQGTAGLGTIGAGTEGLTGLQNQYTQAAQGAAGMLGGTTQDMASQLFQQQQAMRTPEQERQQLALENRLRAQGRLGTTTAAYGGTPEQLAMAKAIQEQQASDAYQSMINAEGMLSSQQARALGLGSAAGQMAGTVSNLLTADQQRALGLGQAGIGATQAAEQLTGAQQARALGLLGAGQQGTQLQDQLLTSQLGRAQGSAQSASALAAANQALQQGDVQTAASLFNIGQAAAQLPSALQSQALQQAGLAQQQAMAPASQQLQQLQQAAAMGQQAAGTNYQAGSLFGQLAGTGLQERLTAESAAAALRGKQYASALDALARQSGTSVSTSVETAVQNISGTIDSIKNGYNYLTDLFNGQDTPSPTFWQDTYYVSQEDQDWLNNLIGL